MCCQLADVRPSVCEGDKKLEVDLDDRLLIPFSQCLRWNNSDDSSPSTEHRDYYDVVDADEFQVRRNTVIFDVLKCTTLGPIIVTTWAFLN